MKTYLEKHKVCTHCLSVDIMFAECRCVISNNYPVIELEFEHCSCCGHIITDGQPAETEFNEKQLKTLK